MLAELVFDVGQLPLQHHTTLVGNCRRSTRLVDGRDHVRQRLLQLTHLARAPTPKPAFRSAVGAAESDDSPSRRQVMTVCRWRLKLAAAVDSGQRRQASNQPMRPSERRQHMCFSWPSSAACSAACR